MGMDVWFDEDGYEMLGRNNLRRPGAHICTCWYYDCKREENEAMCGATRDQHDSEDNPFQLLGLGYLPKPGDCEKCRVLWGKALVKGNIYYHSIHGACSQVLVKEREKTERIQKLETELRELRAS